MKKGEQPELSARWWKSSQPKGLKSAGRLDDALKDYEAAKRRLDQDGNAAASEVVMGALDDVVAAARAVLAEAGKAKGVAEMEWTADAMKKLDREIAAERKAAADSVKEDDDGQFSDPDVYHTYLVTALKRLRTGGEMNFGVVLGKKAEEHRLALHKSKGGKALAGMVARETGLHAMTFGIAMTPRAAGEVEAEQSQGDSDDGGMGDEKSSTLILSLEGRLLPGLKKKLTKMLKRFKPLPFKSVKLMTEGKEIDDLDDPDDTDLDEYDDDMPSSGQGTTGQETTAAQPTAGQLRAVMEKIAPGLKAAMATHPALKDAMMAAASGFVERLKVNDLAGARAHLKQAISLLSSARGTDGGSGIGKVDYTKLRLEWVKARTEAGAGLKRLEEAILADFAEEPDLDDVRLRVRKLDLILEVLGEELQDKLDEALNAPDPAKPPLHREALAIIDRYRTYVDTDAFVTAVQDNPYVPVALQTDLSQTLSNLATALAA